MKSLFFLLLIFTLQNFYARAASVVEEESGNFTGIFNKVQESEDGLVLLNRWDKKNVELPPPGRRWHAMWSGDENIYFFGGYLYDGTVSSKTFKYNHGEWEEISLLLSPSPRQGAKADGGILFGGYGAEGFLSDTWEWVEESESWKKIITSSSPPGRFGHSFAFSPDRSLLFGGVQQGDSYTGDTWEFDLKEESWEKISLPDSPSPRQHGSMAYAGDGKFILFGGYNMEEGFLNDTWLYDLSDYSWTQIYPSSSPPARRRASMSWDPSEKVAVLFGGRDSENVFNDLWVFNPETVSWRLQDPLAPAGFPSPRQSLELAYCRLCRATVLFGGDSSPVELDPEENEIKGDTWEYRLSSTGSYTSSLYDAGYPETTLEYLSLDWDAEVPADGEIRFQLAASQSPETGLFRGPGGGTGSYFTEPGEEISSFFNDKRYFKFRLYMERELPGACNDFRVRNISLSYNHRPGLPQPAPPPYSSAGDGGVSNWPVRFEWSNAPDADGDSLEYELLISTAVDFDPLYLSFSGIEEQYNWSHFEYDLPQGTTYYWKVRAYDGNGWGEYSVPWSVRVDTVPPSQVAGLQAQRAEIINGAVELSWTSTDEEAVDYVIKYDARWQIDNQTGWNNASHQAVYLPQDKIYEGKEEGFTVEGLENNTTYYFAVRARDEAGNLSAISPAQCRTNAPPEIALKSTVAGKWGTGTEKSTSTILFNYHISDPDPEDILNVDIHMAMGQEGEFDILVAEDIKEEFFKWDSRSELNASNYYIRFRVRDKRGLEALVTTGPVSINNYNEPPEVELISPAGGEEWERVRTVQWEYSDPNLRDTHYSTVFVSTDGGSNFYRESPRLGDGVKSYQWGTGNWPDSEDTVVKVVVRDNRGLEGEDISGKFSISNSFSPVNEFGLIYPKSNTFIYYSTPTLNWESTFHPQGLDFEFRLIISTCSSFSPVYKERWFNSSVTEHNLTLEDEKKYYWEVVAVDSELIRRTSKGKGVFIVNTDPISILGAGLGGGNIEVDRKWLVISGTETITVHLNKPAAVAPHGHISFNDQYGNYINRTAVREGESIHITPAPALEPSRKYIITLGKGITDSTGHPLLDRRAQKSGERRIEFVSLLGPEEETEIDYPGRASLKVPARTLGKKTTGYISIDDVDISQVFTAENDAGINPEIGDSPVNLVQIKAYDYEGRLLKSFDESPQIKLFYFEEEGMVMGEDVDTDFLEIFRLNKDNAKGEKEYWSPFTGLSRKEGNWISAHISNAGYYSLRAYSGLGRDFSGLLVYPNPFDPNEGQLNIRFNLGRESRLTFEVYTLIGDLVYRKEESFSKGYGRSFKWDGRNSRGTTAANGMYYARIREKDKEVKSFLIGVLK